MTSQAVKDRLRALRKKHHLGEFRNSTRSVKHTHKRGQKTMAKHRYHSKSRSNFLGVGSAMVGAVVYGAARQKLSDALAPVTSKIPLGNISDEVGMYLVLMIAKKYIGNKVPIVKDIASAGQYIELARIGEAIATGQLGI